LGGFFLPKFQTNQFLSNMNRARSIVAASNALDDNFFAPERPLPYGQDSQ
jgi:hypothetical protein